MSKLEPGKIYTLVEGWKKRVAGEDWHIRPPNLFKPGLPMMFLKQHDGAMNADVMYCYFLIGDKIHNFLVYWSPDPFPDEVKWGFVFQEYKKWQMDQQKQR
jgi:hypothetical protein